ncbi:MAG: glycosyltransferase [Cyanobacteria bacterium]|nr:glycosyltransferase [Cyanobacteriota bacterium]
MNPAILLVVPTLNSHLQLPELVASLQRQTFPHWRVLFVDGPSGPTHRLALQRICAADPRFTWTSQDPALPGIFGAMNQGFAAAAAADWLLFWGSDDRAPADDVLAAAAVNLSEDLDLLVCRGRYIQSQEGASRLGRPTAFRWCGSYARSLLLGSTPPYQATLIGPGARRCLARYADGFRLSADLDYFLALCRHRQLRVAVLDLELVHMEMGGVSGLQHRRRLKEVRWAYRRAFGWFWPFPFLMRYLQRGLSLLG